MKGGTLAETVTRSFSGEEFANWCQKSVWGPDKWPTVFPARLALGFPIHAINHVINPPERYATHSSEFYDFWISDSSLQMFKFTTYSSISCWYFQNTLSWRWSRVHERETFKRIKISWLLEFWRDLILANKMSDPAKVSNAAESSKHEAMSAVWRACFCTHPVRSGILSMKISKPIPFDILLGSYNTTWAKNQFLSSVKTQTAGCRNAAESISENTQGIGK